MQIKPNHRERYQFAIDKIRKRYGEIKPTVLDCACGVGYGTMMIADQVARIATGLDIAEEAIEVANRAYLKGNNEFQVCDLGDNDQWNKVLGDRQFDAIVSIETIEHVEDAEALIKRYSERTNFLVGSVPNEVFVPWKKEQHPFHFRHYTRTQFTELLADHGFKITCWATQYDKIPGEVYEDADDGMGFIVTAVKE